MSDSNRLVAFICLAFTLTMFQSCSPGLVERTKAFEKAYNEGEVEKVLSFYTEDAVHEVPGVFRVEGIAELRDLTEHDVILNTHLGFLQCESEGDTVFCELTFESDWTRTAHMGEVHYSAVLVFRDGLIDRFITEISPEGAKAFSEVYGSFLEWASKERPDRLAEMMREGHFVYNAENARNSLILLREWQEATAQVE